MRIRKETLCDAMVILGLVFMVLISWTDGCKMLEKALPITTLGFLGCIFGFNYLAIIKGCYEARHS